MSALSKLLLGADARQTFRVSQALLVLTVYVVFAGVQHLEVMLGMIEASRSNALTLWNLGGGLLFYACMRSGLNRRLTADRSMAIPQSLWAMVGITWSYAITGPARGAVLLILILVVMFAVFELTPSMAHVVAGVAFAMIGTVAAWMAISDPQRFDPRVELVHLLFAGVVLAASSILAVRVGTMRMRLREQRTHLEQQRAELAEALARIQTLATHDDLTSLPNRRAALDRMNDELAVRRRPELQMTLALMDLDHFKSVNDAHGHAVGDAVLRRFGECAQRAVRAGDLLARWGGEEFLLVMPATAQAQGLAVMSRVREALRQTRFDDLAPGLVVSFSAGLAECCHRGDLDAAVARADGAMYEAKRTGRDRVLTSTTPPGHEAAPVHFID